MDKITRFVECTIPISNCNLRCSYCYVIQENRRNSQTNPFRCTPKEIGNAFRKERWGGTMMINLCGFGETLIPKEMPEIIFAILKEGHYINVTNNGTMSQRFDEIIKFPSEYLHRLCFAFSLHYNELKKTNNLQTFVDNVNKVRNAGCSFLVQLNLADEYMACLDEIKEFCLKEFGAYPQVALTRKEGSAYTIFTDLTDEEYIRIGKSFNSPLFDFTCKNFKVKRKEFCYAGNWTFKLDLATGDLRSCYFAKPHYNIYDHPEEEIKTAVVGYNCKMAYCVNSSHFMSLGVIPSIVCPSYVSLRDRDNMWYTRQMHAFLEQKLYDNHRQYHTAKKICKSILFFLKSGELVKYVSPKRYVSYIHRKLSK